MQSEATRQQPDKKGKMTARREESALQTHCLTAAGLETLVCRCKEYSQTRRGGNIKTDAEKIKQTGKLLCVQVESLAVQI